MSLISALKTLLIPRKSSADTDDLDTDWRAIEIWAQQVTAALKTITPGGFYASLTGPGETNPVGALTQAGDLTVSGVMSVTNNFNQSLGSVTMDSDGFTVSDASSAGIQILETSSGTIVIKNGAHGGEIDLSSGGVQIQGPALAIQTTTKIGFFGVIPQSQQAGAGITTVAQLVTVLQTYGLLS